ncbi:hypothetical protein QWY31_10970 [Cytophagales bacterium LB-30]|uniref:Uncharacterized protein n=1 Tax=Shiella aurantiaca TaxID=3058365 RepID=A0ABT8F7W0_9BACT|nr:hypothetical protein [Shiella aurantiaca]MDN4166026.1 hypothetical protein [Shiella aurantiaca]
MKRNPFSTPFMTSLLCLLLGIQLSYAQGVVIQRSEDGRDGVKSYTSVVNFTTLEFKYKGDIKINDTDSDVTAISPGGFIKIEKTTFGNTRSIYLEGDSDGRIIREYFEGKSKVDYEPNGKRFLNDVLLEVIRAAGFDAEGRTQRIYARGGLESVLNEIDEIPSNRVMAIYYQAMFDKKGLSKEELKATVAHVGEAMSSNSEMGRLLRNNAALFMSDENLSIAFFKAVDQMSSNSEMGATLRHAMKGNLSPQAQIALLNTVNGMSSNSEMGATLRQFSEIQGLHGAASDAYFATIDGMSSNSEVGSVLRNLIKKQNLDAKTYARLFASVAQMSSNTEAGSVLRLAASRMPQSPAVYEGYFKALQSLTSNTETASVLESFISSHPLNEANAKAYFGTVRQMSSNSAMGQALRDVADKINNQKALVEDYNETVKRLSSSSEAGASLRSFIKHNHEEYSLVVALAAASYLSSNSEKGAVLSEAAPYIPKGQNKAREAYKTTANSLSSDSEYRRAMQALE